MGLQIWLPLQGNLENKGLTDVSVTNNGASIEEDGKIGKCYNFGTAKSYLLIPKESMTSATEATVCFWLKILNWNTSYATFFQAGKGDIPWDNYIFGFLRYNTNSTCCFTISDGSSASNGNYLTPNLELNTWYHIGLVYKSGHCLIYINGDLYHDYNTSIVPNFEAITTISVGTANNKTSYQSNCLMNDLRIYDEALSPMQIKLISQGLVAHYLLNNNGGGMPNLLKKTPLSFTPANYTAYQLELINNLEIGKTYTIQFWDVDVSHTGKDASALGISVYWGGGSNLLRHFRGTDYFTDGHADYLVGTFTISSTLTNATQASNAWLNIYNSVPNVDGIKNMHIGHWKLEENSKPTSWSPYADEAIENIEYDVSGYCNNGTKYNITNYITDSPRYSLATIFNGANTYINVGRGGMVKDEITVNVWAYMEDWTAFSAKRFISCTEGGGWNFEPSGNNIHFAIGTGTTSNTYKNTSGYALANLSSGWHMFTGTYDGFTTKQYVDGVLNTSNNAYTTKTPIFYHASNPILIGTEASSTQNPANYYFNGYLSDVRIYATALSDSDIASLYNNSAFIDSSGNVYSTEYIEE